MASQEKLPKPAPSGQDKIKKPQPKKRKLLPPGEIVNKSHTNEIIRVAAQRVHKVGAKVDRNRRIIRLIHVSVQNLYRFWVRILLEMIAPFGRFVAKAWLLEAVDDNEKAKFIPLASNAGAWLTWICLRAWELRLRGADMPQQIWLDAQDRNLTDFNFRIIANLRHYMTEIIGVVTGKDYDVEIQYLHTAMMKSHHLGRDDSNNNTGDYVDHYPAANNWDFPADFSHLMGAQGDDHFDIMRDFQLWDGWLHDRTTGPRASHNAATNWHIKWERAKESYENLVSLRNWKEVKVSVNQAEPVAHGAFLCDVVPRHAEHRISDEGDPRRWLEVTSLSVYATRYLDKSATDTASSMALCLYCGGDVQFWASQATIETLMPGIYTQRPWRSVPTKGMDWANVGWNNCPNLKSLCPTLNWELDARENVGPVVHVYGDLLCRDIIRANKGIGLFGMATTSYNLTGASAAGILFEYKGSRIAFPPQEERVRTRVNAGAEQIRHTLYPTPWRTTPSDRWELTPRQALPENIYRWGSRINPCVGRNAIPQIAPECVRVVMNALNPAWGDGDLNHRPVATDGNWKLTPVRCLYAGLIHDDITETDVKAIKDEMIRSLRKYEK